VSFCSLHQKLQTAIATTNKYIYTACLRAEAAEKQEKHIWNLFQVYFGVTRWTFFKKNELAEELPIILKRKEIQRN
jgi:hypothetical protein